MGSFAVVEVGPWLEVLVSLQGVCPVFCIGPLAQGGLDEAFSLSVGSGSVGPGAVMFDRKLVTCLPKLPGSITGSVVCKQGAYFDAVLGEEVQRLVEEADGGFSLLIGQHAGEGHA